jgi:hypothetical protein
MGENSQTFGQKAVGLSFNPSNIDAVSTAKQTLADAIDQMNHFKGDCMTCEGARKHADVAIEKLIDAQMWMVKAITWKD